MLRRAGRLGIPGNPSASGSVWRDDANDEALAISTFLVAMLAGCAGGTSGPTPAPTEAPGGSSTAGPSATPAATAPGLPAASTPVLSPAPSSPTPAPSARPAASPSPTPTPAPSLAPTARPTTAPTTAPTLTLAELRYRLADGLGRPLFCDPDFYPVARNDEAVLAEARFPEIRADAATFTAIAAHVKVSSAPTPAEILAVYREWKMLNAVILVLQGADYGFGYIAASAPGASDGWHVAGLIHPDGTITTARKDPSGPPPCPIRLARGTRIATPQGPVAVEDVVPGMAVWTADSRGQRVAGRVIAVGSTAVASTHRVVHLVLADGRILDASPGHPLPDGRRLSDLGAGDFVDGARVVSAVLVPYAGGATFDLLPSGPTGVYWAGDSPLGSTLNRASNPAP